MTYTALHSWDLTPTEARALQAKLAERLVLADRVGAQPRLVAGIDCAYAGRGAETVAHAAVVVVQIPELEVVESRHASVAVRFPYVPGLLSFREAPAALAALSKVEQAPGLLMLDGQGLAHPRRLGLACHLGVLTGVPSIGCAKSRLIGAYEEPGGDRGCWSPLTVGADRVGAVLRTRPGHRPLFVSQGHLVSLERAVDLVLYCCREGQFLPEPTRLAHLAAARIARPVS
ncbi:MAG TPA: deoxyribonuclease V [Armatimonadota bacterium]|jgi:deoxyribonuclease V